MTTANPTPPRTPAEARKRVDDAKRHLFARIIASAHLLDTPFTNAPDQSPWSRLKQAMGSLTAALDELDTASAHQTPDQHGATVYQLPAEPPGVLAEIVAERQRQDAKWGEQNHPDGTGGPVMQSRAEEARAQCQFLAANGGSDWRAILLEEVYEALAEDAPGALRTELIQVAAVAVQWVQAIDRRPLSTTPPAGTEAER